METDRNTLTFDDLKWDGWRQAEKTITFDGGTTNAIGDHDGTGDPFDIFTVTGDVIVKVIGTCSVNLVGAATLEVGITGNTAAVLAQVADATDIDAGDIWHDATVDKGIELSSVMLENIIANGQDIIGTVGTANITAGVIKFICLWKPLSEDSSVVAA